jgi:hypothetical protein
MSQFKTVLFGFAILLIFVSLSSCSRNDAGTQRVFQQITVLSEEVRATNSEVKLLRQEVAALRQVLADGDVDVDAALAAKLKQTSTVARPGESCPVGDKTGPSSESESARPLAPENAH